MDNTPKKLAFASGFLGYGEKATYLGNEYAPCLAMEKEKVLVPEKRPRNEN